MAEPFDDDVAALAAALAELVRKGGTDLASDSKRVRATLSDLLGSGGRSSRAHVDAIVLASEERVPDRLHTDPSCVDSLVAQLLNRGLNDEMAAFAVASWRFALGQSPDAPSEPSVHATSTPLRRNRANRRLASSSQPRHRAWESRRPPSPGR